MHRGIPFVANLLLVAGATLAQGPLTAQLVANADLIAQRRDLLTNVVVDQQVWPAGPLTAATVQVAYAPGFGGYARYACDLAPAGDGWTLQAESSASWLVYPYEGSCHADLTLTIGANGASFATVDATLVHLGDYPGPGAFRVDLGDDGSTELSSWWPGNNSYEQRRTWIWDFAGGDLVLRLRSDQATDYAPQAHALTLQVQPWVPGAAPAAAGSTATAYIPVIGIGAHSTNYSLVAAAPTQPQHTMDLRATGLGQFSLFLVSDVGTTQPLLLPAPWNTPSPALGNVLLFDFGVVTATVPLPPSAPTPRQWRLPVPPLPPGLTFYVQHASANQFYAFWFGTSNVVRIDT